jgi:2-methylcitrate dehydratase PrpD
MNPIAKPDRRALLVASTGLAAPTLGAVPQAQASAPPVTRILARYIVNARPADMPAPVRREGCRTLLNYVGVAVGGSRHQTVEHAIAAIEPFSGKAEASLLGRSERLDILNAALINGISSHIFDYDDTHLKTIIHPAGPVVSAALALAQHRKVTGTQFLLAMLLGIETECRIGNAVYPSHYDMGWHITGSCGVFGSAAACGKLLGLSEQQMVWALGIAASQPVGLKVQFGSMTKSFHAGRAAQNGLTAALLAAQNFTSDDTPLEGKDGWAQALSQSVKWQEVTGGLGSRFEAALNTYKPFACGIVAHPAIDAAIQLRDENRFAPGDIAAVELRANPLVLSLTGKKEPSTGLEGKFSIYHCIAVGLIFGAAGEKQFQDAVVRDPVVVTLRRKVSVHPDAGVGTTQCDLILRLKDGRKLVRHIEHAIGSLERPMSDAALEAKFLDLTDGIIPRSRAKALIRNCRAVEQLPDAGSLALAAAI